MEKIKAKVENMLHKDNTSTTGNTNTGTTSTSTYGNETATGAPHTSHTANRADPTISSGQHTGVTGTHGSDPTGPHDSKLANTLDPRVDSKHAGSYGNTGAARDTTGYGNTHSATGNTHPNTAGNTFGAGTHSKNTYGSDPTGPHDSHLANVADPRVSTDRAGQGYGNTNTTSGFGGNTHTSNTQGGYSGSDPRGPHDSHLANAADPRINSDRVGQGYGNTSTGNTFGTGSNTHSTTHGGYSDPSGPHDSRLGNAADPRIDSNRVGNYGNTTGNTYGAGNNLPGPADKTAGPHKSNILNSIDPRIDGDLDGSKTIGGDRTYG